MKRILVDIGSSTIKIYEFDNGILNLTIQRSILFKNEFNPQDGFSKAAKQELFDLLNTVKLANPNTPIQTYATAVFRNLLPLTQKLFIEEVFQATGIHFNIISQELENHYLEKALLDRCNLKDPVLIINIGGGSTELIFAHEEQVIERLNVDFGVGTIIKQFSNINDPLSSVSIDSVVNHVKNLLPTITTRSQVAFYTGGELDYMLRAKYPLKHNTLFQDSDHQFIIELTDFQIKNKDIYEKITFKELESLMPDNPK